MTLAPVLLPAVGERLRLLAVHAHPDDEAIATGGSMAACLRLLRRAGATVVGIGVLLVEGEAWKAVLGDDAPLVHSLGEIPAFTRTAGGWTAVW